MHRALLPTQTFSTSACFHVSSTARSWQLEAAGEIAKTFPGARLPGASLGVRCRGAGEGRRVLPCVSGFSALRALSLYKVYVSFLCSDENVGLRASSSAFRSNRLSRCRHSLGESLRPVLLSAV